MTAVGMIHMACYCGAELLYLGDTVDGAVPVEMIDKLRGTLVSGSYGFFTSANGRYGECPHCGTLFELPPASLVNRLPLMTRTEVLDMLGVDNGSRMRGQSREARNGLAHSGDTPVKKG